MEACCEVLKDEGKLRVEAGLFRNHVAKTVPDHNQTFLEHFNLSFGHVEVDITISHLFQDFRQLFRKHHSRQSGPLFLRNNTYVCRYVNQNQVLADKFQIASLNIPDVHPSSVSLNSCNLGQQFLQVFVVDVSRIVWVGDPIICQGIVALLVFTGKFLFTIEVVKALAKCFEVFNDWQSFQIPEHFCIGVVLHHLSHPHPVFFRGKGKLLH